MAFMIVGERSGVVRFSQNSGVGFFSEARPSQLTQNPMENGSTASDHHHTGPRTFSIEGITVGGYAAYETLERMQENSERITYLGHFRRNNLLITELSRNFSASNANGCAFRCSFAQAAFVGTERVIPGQAPLMSSTGLAAIGRLKNEGRITTSLQTLSNAAFLAYLYSHSRKPAATRGIGLGARPSINGIR